MSIKVTALDLETGKSETATIDDDYCLITAGRYQLTNTQVYENGTHVLTLKITKEDS